MKRVLAITLVVVALLLFQGVSSTARSDTAFDSPVPTPPVPPTPWPTISPDLPNAERALQFVAQRQAIPQEWLTLADVFTTELPLAA